MCDAGPMAQTVCVIVSAADRERLQAIIGDRNQPRKHIERACLVLASAEREPAQRVAAGVGVSRPTVWRWQQRYAEVGVEGLLRDKTRKPGKTPIAAQTTARVVALTCTTPPHQATHWTGRAMAKAVGISLRSVQRIWQAHQQLCCQAGRCCRPLRRSTGPRRGALARRKEPDPSPRPHPTGAADQAGALSDYDA